LGIKFGEIDASQILDNEFRILVLERVVDRLLAVNPASASGLDINAIRAEVVEILKKKYPNSGIGLKE
jgi:hypothetical protein